MLNKFDWNWCETPAGKAFQGETNKAQGGPPAESEFLESKSTFNLYKPLNNCRLEIFSWEI